MTLKNTFEVSYLTQYDKFALSKKDHILKNNNISLWVHLYNKIQSLS